MKLYRIGLVAAVFALAGVTGCKKTYLDTRPSDQVPLSDAFKTTIGCKAAIQGMNAMMFESSDHDLFGEPSVMIMEDLMGADMPMADRGSNWFVGTYSYTDSRNAGSVPGYTWGYYYRFINNANQVLDHVAGAEGSQEDKDFIRGQALFYRAFALFKLSIYYQFTYVGNEGAKGVPVYTSATQKGNPRGTMQQTYAQIVKDLDEAITLLPNGTRVDKTDPDVTVAKGLYARVALVMQNWTKAAQMAKEARTPYAFAAKEQLLGGFNDIGNPEWMWGCSINAEQSGIYGSFLSHMVVASNGYAFSSQKLGFKYLVDSVQKYDTADVRKNWWYGSSGGTENGISYKRYSQKKFGIKKPGSWVDDKPFMRASEMALVEAEALAEANQVSQAAQVLESVIKIRNPYFVAKTTRIELLRQIMWQRRVELWGEGFSFSDIKRYMGLPNSVIPDDAKGLQRTATGTNHQSTIAQVMSIASGSTQFLFRIPGAEINQNSSFTGADQNP